MTEPVSSSRQKAWVQAAALVSTCFACHAAAAQPASAASGEDQGTRAPPLRGLPDGARSDRRAPELVREATLVIRVDDPPASERRLIAIGAAQHWTVEADSRVVLRVPTDELERAVALAAEVGSLAARTESARDVSNQLAQLDAKIRTLEEASTRSLDRVRSRLGPQQGTAVELAVGDLDRALDSARAQRARLWEEASAVRLQVRLERRTPMTPERVGTPELPVPWLKRLGLAELKTPTPTSPDGERAAGRVSAWVEGSVGVTTWYADDLPSTDARSWAALASTRAHAYGAARRAGVATAFRAGLGGGTGLAYELGWTVGPGVSLCSRSVLALTTGLGARSWSGNRVRAGLDVPLELWSATRLGSWAMLSLTASPRWVPWVHRRHRGSAVAPFADELSLGALIGLAPSGDVEKGALSVGYAYTELEDTRMHQVLISFGAGVTESR